MCVTRVAYQEKNINRKKNAIICYIINENKFVERKNSYRKIIIVYNAGSSCIIKAETPIHSSFKNIYLQKEKKTTD